MDKVNQLLSLWRSNAHIPEGKDIKQLVPRREDHRESELVDFLGDSDYTDAVKLTLSTLLNAWTELCSTDPDDLSDTTLQTKDLLLIAHIVPLYLPKQLPQDLQKSANRKANEDPTHGRKRKAKGFTTRENSKKPLTFADIIAMGDSDIPEKFRGLAGQNNKGRRQSSPITISSGDEAGQNKKSQKRSSPTTISISDEGGDESENEAVHQVGVVDDDPDTTQRPAWSPKTKRLARNLGVHATQGLKVNKNASDGAKKKSTTSKKFWATSSEHGSENEAVHRVDKNASDGAKKKPTTSKKFRATSSEEHDADENKDWSEYFPKMFKPSRVGNEDDDNDVRVEKVPRG